MTKVSADYDYIQGHLRYGHIEMDLNDEELAKFKSMSEQEQYKWLEDDGEVIVDDFEINDKGSLSKIEIEE